MSDKFKTAAYVTTRFFDGTLVDAQAIVSEFPTIISIQSDTDPNHVILAIKTPKRNYVNAYTSEYIVFLSRSFQPYFEYEDIQVWNQTQYAKYFSESGGGGYVLPVATDTILGGVKIGDGIDISGGKISVDIPLPYTLPKATATVLGGVTIGSNIDVLDGKISVTFPDPPAPYVLPTASTTILGGVKIDGTSITISDGVISGASTYVLPKATSTILGGVTIGSNIDVLDGEISVTFPTPYTLPKATASVLGGVTIGSNIDVLDGEISVTFPTPYTLPTASTTTLGGVKVDGTSITILDGVISSSGSSSGDVTGPSSSVNNTIASFNGTTGKIIKDSGIQITNLVNTGGNTNNINIFSSSSASGFVGSTGKRNVILRVEDVNSPGNAQEAVFIGYEVGRNMQLGLNDESSGVYIGAMIEPVWFGNGRASPNNVFLKYDTEVLIGSDIFPLKNYGYSDIALGNYIGNNLTRSNNNVFIGQRVGGKYSNPAPGTIPISQNIAIGYRAASGTDGMEYSGSTNTNEICIGTNSGNPASGNNTVTTDCIHIGRNTFATWESDRCTYLGYNANNSGTNFISNSTAIGQDAHTTKSNQMVLGASTVVETLIRGTVIAPKIMLTPEGGYAVSVINQTGETSVKGKVVTTHPDFDNAVRLCPIDNPAPIGFIYNAGITVGSLMWVVVSGIAEVLFVNNVERNWFGRTCMSTDPGAEAGKCFGEVLPAPPFATDKHFMECLHTLETKTAGTLVKGFAHYN